MSQPTGRSVKRPAGNLITGNPTRSLVGKGIVIFFPDNNKMPNLQLCVTVGMTPPMQKASD